MKDFFDNHMNRLKEERRVKLNLSKEEFEKLLLDEANEAVAQQELIDEQLRNKSKIEQEELEIKRVKFAQSLRYMNESFHLATIVSIKHVNELSGGTKRNNVIL